jgi:membrane-bound serine protease (ClpP class)
MPEIFYNPNVAYLILVAAFSMAMLAVITPGTGLLEIGALFGLFYSAWAVFNLPFNWWALGILLLGTIPFLIAVRRSNKRIYLIIAILALAVGSSFLFTGKDGKPAVNPLLALAVSSLVGIFFWIATTKALEARSVQPTHDLASLIGALGEAKTDIFTEGTVQVAGELWSAFSETPIQTGAIVRVVEREGFLLKVEVGTDNPSAK